MGLRSRERVVPGRKWDHIASTLGRLFIRARLSAAWPALEEALASEKAGSPLEEIEAHAYAAHLATVYGVEAIALRLCDRLQERLARSPETTRGLEHAVLAVRLLVAINLKRRDEADVLERAIDWDLVPALGWLRNLELRCIVRRNSRADLLSALARRKAGALCALSRERAALLATLADDHAQRGQLSRAAVLYRKALLSAQRGKHFDCRLQEAAIQARLGAVELERHALERSSAAFSAAIARLRHHGVEAFEQRLRIQHAAVWVERGAPDRAERTLRAALKVLSTSSQSLSLRAPMLLWGYSELLDVCILRGRFDDGRAVLAAAQRTLRHCDTPKYRGRFHLLRARLLLGRNTRSSLERALEALLQAERCYREVGEGYLPGLSWVEFERSQVLLRLQKVAQALERTTTCLGFLQSVRPSALGDRCLLLRSQLLLEENVPRREALYEHILGSLGRARSPVTLLQVISNLYMYSWDLKDGLDLTASHLLQANQLARNLDSGTFERLYHEHVTRRVLGRALAVTFRPGHSPGSGESR